MWQNPASEIHQEKERRGLYIERIEIKYFLLADDTIVYVESLKESMKKKNTWTNKWFQQDHKIQNQRK